MTKNECRTLIFAPTLFKEVLKYSSVLKLDAALVSMIIRLSSEEHNPAPEVTEDFKTCLRSLLKPYSVPVIAFALWKKGATKLEVMLKILGVNRSDRKALIKAANKVKTSREIAQKVKDLSVSISILEGEYDFEVI